MRRLFLIALALTILLPLLAVMLVLLAAAGESAAQCGAVFAGSSGPVGGVPAADIPIFQGAAAQFALGPRGPSILAAINYADVRAIKRRGRALGREPRRRDGPDAIPAEHLGHLQGAGTRRRGAPRSTRRSTASSSTSLATGTPDSRCCCSDS